MKSLNALIVDDEPKACKFLNSLIDEFCPDIQEVKLATSPENAIGMVKQYRPDILFLDINMPQLSGFDFLDNLEGFQGKVIFTTAHSDFAVRAFKYHAFDYLLKPINVNQLTDSVSRVVSSIQETEHTELSKLVDTFQKKEKYKNSLAIHDKGGLVFIDLNDICYFESQGNYTKVCCTDRVYTSSKTVKVFEDLLDPDLFVRVHRSYIVNIKKVVRYITDEGGQLILKNNCSIPVSRRKRHVLDRFSV